MLSTPGKHRGVLVKAEGSGEALGGGRGGPGVGEGDGDTWAESWGWLGVNKGLEMVVPERESSHRLKRGRRFPWVVPYNGRINQEVQNPWEGMVGGCPMGFAEPSILTFLKAVGSHWRFSHSKSVTQSDLVCNKSTLMVVGKKNIGAVSLKSGHCQEMNKVEAIF